MSEVLALSFNPLRGPFGPSAVGRPTAPFVDFCAVVRTPCGSPSSSGCPGDTTQISWGKPLSLPRTPAGFTVQALDGYGLRDFLPARPTRAASYPVAVRQVAISFHASFRRPSRFRPCAPLVLHLHQVAQGTFTSRLLDMPSTQDAARRQSGGLKEVLGPDPADGHCDFRPRRRNGRVQPNKETLLLQCHAFCNNLTDTTNLSLA